MESYNWRELSSLGINATFVQDNHSYSTRKGVIRGLHFQNDPMAQCKLVRCVRGLIQDVVVDIRRGSPTRGRWVSTMLSSKNKRQVFVPKGYAHGFLALEDHTEVEYKVDTYYEKSLDRSIRWDDPDIGIRWRIRKPILSDKDACAPRLRDVDCSFVYEETKE